MLGYPAKTYKLPYLKRKWYLLKFLTILLLFILVLSGCNPNSSKKLYVNPENGISLEKPQNWDLAFYERSGIIVLESESGVFDNDSARIEIFAGSCPPDPINSNGSQISSNEILEREIHRIRVLYNLDTVTIIQEPIEVETGDYVVTKAIINIPTMSMLDDSARVQVGNPEPDLFQTIEIDVIRDSDNTIMAYVYKGNSKVLNAQAQEIVNGIQRTCSIDS